MVREPTSSARVRPGGFSCSCVRHNASIVRTEEIHSQPCCDGRENQENGADNGQLPGRTLRHRRPAPAESSPGGRGQLRHAHRRRAAAPCTHPERFPGGAGHRRPAHRDVRGQARPHTHPRLDPDRVHAGTHRRTLPAPSPAPLRGRHDCRPADVRRAVRSFLCLLQPGRSVHVRASQVFRKHSQRAQPGAPARRTRPPDHPGRAAGGEARKRYADRPRVHQLDGRR